ncbi:hypothetical protein PS2_024484 [Malus domestica]
MLRSMELTKCLGSRIKRRGGNNCTVTDDDGNKGKHDRKHEIDVVNHIKDNKISNDKREGKKSRGGGYTSNDDTEGPDGADVADGDRRGADGEYGLDVASV